MNPPLSPELTLRRVPLSGGRAAHCVDLGEGPDTLVLLHGYPGRPHDFRWMLAGLAAQVRVLLPAMPGLGLTPLSAGPAVDLDGRVAFLQELLDALGLERMVLGGHSMGGGMALRLAERWPARVRGLALLASVGPRPHLGLRRSRPDLAASLLDQRALDPLTRPLLRAAFRALGFPTGISDAALRHTVACASATDFDAIRRAALALQAPTFLAHADDDPLVESEITDALAGICPPGPRLRFATGGHGLPKTRAAALNAALLEWIPSLPR